MKRLASLLLFLLLCLPVFAQTTYVMRLDSAKVSRAGVLYALPGAQIRVCQYNVLLKCIAPVSIYSDPNGQNLITQPLSSDANGNYQYFTASNQQLVEQISSPGTATQSYAIVLGGGGSTRWGGITGTLADQTDLASALSAKVPTTATVNGHTLSGNVTVSPSDVGNTTAQWNANQINGKSIDSAAPTSGDFLNFNGTAWVHTQPSSSSLSDASSLMFTSTRLLMTQIPTGGSSSNFLRGDGTWSSALPILNASVGFQVNGSYGANGQCLTSTGGGSAWGSCSGTGSGMIYPAAGVPNSTGSAWGTSYAVGTAANNLVQLNASAQLPAVSGANLTNLPAGNLTGTVPTAATSALAGDVVKSAGSSATTIASGAVSGAKLATANRTRTCTILIGADNGSSLATADIQPQKSLCKIDVASTVSEIDVLVDAGASTVQVGYRHLGSTTALTTTLTPATVSGITDKVVCANVGGTAATIEGASVTCSSLSASSLTAGDWIETLAGTADGTTKRMSIAVTFTVN